MAKKRKKTRDKREEKLLLLTELIAVTTRDGVLIVHGRAGDYLRTVAVTPGYARALAEAFARLLDKTDSGENVINMRAGH